MQRYYEVKTSLGVMRGFFHEPDLQQFPVCIIFHGFTGNHMGTKFSYTQISRLLEANGIGSLRLDFLGSGDSDMDFCDMTFDIELECAKLILQHVIELPKTSAIYLLGHSMGGAVASELAKLYPEYIAKMCLWAPAFNLPDAIEYLKGNVPRSDYYDHGGFQISDAFVEDMISRDFYHHLDAYQNPLMIIHGTKDTTVPYEISQKYLKGFTHCDFHPIEGATHNYDDLSHIQQVIALTVDFMTKEHR